MRPCIFRLAAPATDFRASASGNAERTFVARSLHDDVIPGTDHRMIEDEDSFFGRGNDENVFGLNLLVHAGDGFPKRRCAKRFRVTAPVLEEGVVGAGFEGEKIRDSARFGVGRGQKILRGELIFAEILLDPEGCNLHAISLPRARQECRGPI